MAGHIQLDRKILKWEWYDDSNTFRLFLHLLLNANHAPSSWHGIPIKRGQHLTGRLKLATALRLSEMQIRTSLDKLKKTGEITVQSTKHYSMITICKYGSYQSGKKTDNQQDNQQSTIPITNEQPTGNQQVTTNKNDNNEKNESIKDFVPAPVVDLSKSNLYRQPNIPKYEQVYECFKMKGGTEEMAKNFFNTHESTEWFYKGSPITNFTNLVPSYVASWKRNETRNGGTVDSTNVKIALK